MDDFITLTCPTCGGKLLISPDTLTLSCQHCGTEHMVRRDAGNILLETYAKCPICNRNDKSVKVSSIVASGTIAMDGVTIEKRTYTDSDGRPYTSTEQVPFEGLQKSVLVQRLTPPIKPVPNYGSNPSNNMIIRIILYIFMWLLLYGICFCSGIWALPFLYEVENPSVIGAGAVFLLYGIVGLFLLIVTIGPFVILNMYSQRTNNYEQEKAIKLKV